ncbi:MAG TPA: BglII/BstYI family type II restriction endonuclease [Ktedonobacterales bacterium]
MLIVATYSFNRGKEVVESQFRDELEEIQAAIANVDAAAARIKESLELTMPGRMLYSPVALNKALLDEQLYKQGWTKPRIVYHTTVPETGEAYSGFIEGDGVKNGLGLEVQFGKYAFLGWDVLVKMPIFAQRGYFQAGVEVVPMRSFVRGWMSTGIGCFEQIRAILEYRGVSNRDIPVLVLGVGTSASVTGEEQPT